MMDTEKLTAKPILDYARRLDDDGLTGFHLSIVGTPEKKQEILSLSIGKLIAEVEPTALIRQLAERFCAASLPATVCADPCATKPGAGRTGTNLLTVQEAMIVIADMLVGAEANG